MSAQRFLSPVFFFAILFTIQPLVAQTPTVTDNIKWPVGAVPGGETNGPDTLDDIWQGKFDAWGIDPDADTDGDGRENIDESIEGTDPFDENDRTQLTDVELTSDVLFKADVKAGKAYRILSTSDLQTSWTAETLLTPVAAATEYRPSADQADVSFSIAMPVADRKYYRLETSEIDDNTDGVSDWVAMELGLNPTATDSDGNGVSDADQLTEELTTQDVVTIDAENAFTQEDGGQPGMLKLRRNHSLMQATTIYTLGGTATSGTDYTPLPSPVDFPRGTTEVALAVSPMEDAPLLEGGESVTVALDSAMAENGAPLALGAPDNAAVIILDPTVPTGTGLRGRYYDTSSNSYTNAANFNPAQLKVDRIDPTVGFDWGYGTPNAQEKPADGPGENYSVRWTGFLQPTVAGLYTFRLLTDDDDQARILLDTDGSGPGGLVQILENGWDTAATGGFKTSGDYTFAIPATPGDRYQIRVEFIETTGNATCRVQWDTPTTGFQNIPAARVFRDNINTNTRWEATYYDGTNQDFSLNVDKGTQFDSNVTNGNNGIWGVGSPDPSMDRQTFSVRWTGQMQPQFTEEYTISVIADDTCTLFINGEEQQMRAAAQGNVGGGNAYTYDDITGDAVITYTNSPIVTGNILAGEIIRIDPTNGPLASLGTTDYLVTAATSDTFTVNFGTGTFTSGTGNMNIEALNRPLKSWGITGIERFVRLPLIGGTRYDIQLDYKEGGGRSRCILSWYSPSQPKQIIPAERLYPSTGTLAPASHITPTEATALAGGPFSLPIAGSNGSSVVLSGNPPWLSYAGGELTGTPPLGTSAGTYQILVTMTNVDGTSTSLVNLTVEETDGQVDRDFWTSVSGTSVADIPVDTAPSGTDVLTSLEAVTDFGDNYGARVIGHFTAPQTGNYYFWVAASNAAELWISNDDEPVNAFKRAEVITGSATPQTWNAEAGQRSAWLALEQGQRYYFEILHKAGSGPGDNLAVGWAKPGDADTAPSEVIPGYVLDTYAPPAPGSTPGTLYVATMLAQGAAISSGVGSSTLRVSEDETTAIMSYDYDNLTGPITSQHIHTDPYQTHASTIVYDIDTPANPGDGLITDPQDPNFGSYLWTITGVGTLTAADIIEIIKQGKAYINLHTAAYPAGEIRGNYTLAIGSRTFDPPPAEPSYTDDHTTDAGAARFLTQATFGPNIDDIAALKAMPSYEAWIDDQFTKPASLHLPEVYRTEDANAQGGAFDERFSFNAWWFRSLAGDDQLRQRIAFALSEIHVVSGQGPLNNRADALSYFYDKLLTNAFGNFRDILEDTTLTPTMGRYLDMLRNDKPNQALGRIPNENYAREIKQLFSVGLFRMWPDGTLILTSEDAPIDVYSQREIIGFSHVFTGWTYGYDGPYRTNVNAPADWDRQMREVPARHFTGEKRLLNNEVLPGLQTLAGQPLDPYAFHNVTHFDHPEYQALAAQELDDSHDQLFNHPNTGPFICRQLIQRLVTSHPSRDYLYRVVQKFNDNGSGVRGDMKAVIKQILLDYEARSGDMLDVPAYGKQREPVMRIAAAGRALRPTGFSGTYTQSNTSQTTNHQIFITTATPHGLANGNQVFLEFTDTTGDPNQPAPFIGAYSVQSATATTFRVTDKSWAFSSTGGYTIPAGSTTCTVNMNNHWLQGPHNDGNGAEPGHQVYVDFRTGSPAGSALDEQVYTVTANTGPNNNGQSGNGATFSFTVPSDPAARTGALRIQRFNPGSYTARNSGLAYPNNRRVTMDTDFDHHLKVGDQVQLNFTAGNPLPLDAIVTVDTVDDLNTWSYLTNSDAATGFANNENNNGVYQFPLVRQPTIRSGDIGSRPSTFTMNNTDADLAQSPLNAETVFNFFLPDFKNPGLLASQGITTPEFQTTAETTVIRQANYLYDGVFFPNTTNGYSSFRRGNNAIVMDLSPWMPEDATNVGLGAPDNTSLPWTHRQNIDVLIDHLSTLLTADQLSAEAKQIIENFVALKISAVATGNPCQVTTASPHGYQTGDTVHISDVTGGFITPTMNNTNSTRTITVTGTDTFTVTGVNCILAPTNLSNATVSQVVYNQGDNTPEESQKRDRLRAVLHLILTSPDFTIQR